MPKKKIVLCNSEATSPPEVVPYTLKLSCGNCPDREGFLSSEHANLSCWNLSSGALWTVGAHLKIPPPQIFIVLHWERHMSHSIKS